MTPRLYPYQENAVNRLISQLKTYLALPMGLGKTAIAIKTITRTESYPALIVCPAIAQKNWFNEIKKWTGFSDLEIKKRFVITSYEMAVKNYSSLGIHPGFKSVVFDESHYLMNPTTKRVKKLLSDKDALIRNIPRVIFMSGTPIRNNVSEIYAPMHSIGAIPESYSKFCDRYCEFERVYLPNRRVITKVSGSMKSRIPELKERLKPFMLMLTYAEAKIDLPAVHFSTYPLDIHLNRDLEWHDKQATKMLDASFAANLDDLTALLACAESLSTLRRLHAESKVDACADLIAEEIKLGLYNKAIVFAHHQSVIEELDRRLKARHISSVFVHGGVAEQDRYKAIDRFQHEGVQVYIGSILASGTAVNLFAASQVIFLEQSFVPGDNAQAIARAARIGQKEKTVFVRSLILSGSKVDERISEILQKKTIDLELFNK